MNSKKTIQVSGMRPAAQGDVLFRRVSTVPPKYVRTPVRGAIIVAHSETGHHHSIDATDGVSLFRDPADSLVCYLSLEGIEYADVVHHRAWDTHATLRLLGGQAKEPTIFEVRRQREFTPDGWRRVED